MLITDENEFEAWLVLRQILLCGSAHLVSGLCECIYGMAAFSPPQCGSFEPLITEATKDNMLRRLDREWIKRSRDMKFPHRTTQWFDNGFLYPPRQVKPRIALCERFAIEAATDAIRETQLKLREENSRHKINMRTLARNKAMAYASLHGLREFIK